jgi:hypothetical protein
VARPKLFVLLMLLRVRPRVSPACSFAHAMSPWYAVAKLTPTHAACSKLRLCGFGDAASAGM